MNSLAAPQSQSILTPRRVTMQGPTGPVQLLNVPDVRQDEDYTCGPSSLQAVLGYYGDEQFESDLAQLCQADPNEGTPPANIAKAARELGYQAEIRENLTIKDLEDSLAQDIPVIIDAQAWRDEQDKNTPWKDLMNSGHYMVVIGTDAKNIYLEDPSIFHSKGVIAKQEFLDRWHDIDGTQPTNHLGIFITGKPAQPFPDILPVD